MSRDLVPFSYRILALFVGYAGEPCAAPLLGVGHDRQGFAPRHGASRLRSGDDLRPQANDGRKRGFLVRGLEGSVHVDLSVGRRRGECSCRRSALSHALHGGGLPFLDDDYAHVACSCLEASAEADGFRTVLRVCVLHVHVLGLWVESIDTCREVGLSNQSLVHSQSVTILTGPSPIRVREQT